MACLLIVYKFSSLWKQKMTVDLTSVARFLSVLGKKEKNTIKCKEIVKNNKEQKLSIQAEHCTDRNLL